MEKCACIIFLLLKILISIASAIVHSILNLKNQDFRTLKGNHGKDFSTLSCLFNVKDHCALKPRGPINDQLPGCL